MQHQNHIQSFQLWHHVTDVDCAFAWSVISSYIFKGFYLLATSKFNLNVLFGSRYSRMDQVKFVEDSLCDIVCQSRPEGGEGQMINAENCLKCKKLFGNFNFWRLSLKVLLLEGLSRNWATFIWMVKKNENKKI